MIVPFQAAYAPLEGHCKIAHISPQVGLISYVLINVPIHVVIKDRAVVFCIWG